MVRNVFGLHHQPRITYNIYNTNQHCRGHHHGGGYSGWGSGLMMAGGIFGIVSSIMNLVGTFRGGYSNPYAYFNSQYTNNTTNTTTNEQGLAQLQNEFGEDGYEFSVVGNTWIAEKDGKRISGTSIDDLTAKLIAAGNGDSTVIDPTAKEVAEEALRAKASEGNSGITENDNGTFTLTEGNVKFKVNDDGQYEVISPDNLKGNYISLDAIKAAVARSSNNDGNDPNAELTTAMNELVEELGDENATHNAEDGTYTINGVTVKVEDGKLKVTASNNPNIQVDTVYNNVDDLKEAVIPDSDEETEVTDGNDESEGNDETATVIVKNGESIQALARKYGVSAERLKSMNESALRSYTTDCDEENPVTREFFLVGAKIKVPRTEGNADVIAENEYTENDGDKKVAAEVNKYRTAVRSEEHLATIECEDQARGEGVLTDWQNYESTQRTQGTEISNEEVARELEKAGLLSNSNIKVDLDKKEITYKKQGEEVKVQLNKENLETAITTVKAEISELEKTHKDDSWKLQVDQGFGNDQQFVTESNTIYEIVDERGDHLNQFWFTANKYENNGDKENKIIRFTDRAKDFELSHIENPSDRKERIPVENIGGRVYVILDGDKILLEDFLQAAVRTKNAEGYQYEINNTTYKLERNEDGTTKLVKQG